VAIYTEVAGDGPALALVHEGICDSRISDRLAREIPGVRHATIAATAHVPSMERPAEFDELVLGFLEEAA
jgi:pimeloyl-ACP methyl ester carboxylesterase